MFNQILKRASNTKKELASELIVCLQERMSNFSNPVFQTMNWLDLKNWLDNSSCGNNQVEFLADHFEAILLKEPITKSVALLE